MSTPSWWQRLFQNRPKTVRRKLGRSTRLMEVEELETRMVPANITITVTGAAEFTDTGAPGLTAAGANHFTATDLRQAVAGISADSLHGNITILLPTGTIKLNQGNGEIVLASSLTTAGDKLTIRNGSGGVTTIDGTNNSYGGNDGRIFEISDADENDPLVTLDHLQLQNATEAGSDPAGGAIDVDNDAVLTLTNDVLTGNSATGTDEAFGGAIRAGNGSVLNLTNDLVSSNSATAPFGAYGGAIETDPGVVLTLSGDRFTQNNATATSYGGGLGGAILAGGGAGLGGPKQTTNSPARPTVPGEPGGPIGVTIVNTTIDHNTAKGGNTNGENAGGAEGGGLFSYGGGAVAITASTFNNNKALGGSAGAEGGNGGFAYGGGIIVEFSSTSVSVVNTTIANNTAQGGNGAATESTSYGGDAYGGGIYTNQNEEGGSVTLVNDTIALNQVVAGTGTEETEAPLKHTGVVPVVNPGTASGGGVYLEEGTVKVLNTIIAANDAHLGLFRAGPNASSVQNGVSNALGEFVNVENDIAVGFAENTFTDLGHNLIGVNDPGAGFTKPTDFLGTLLDPVNPGFAAAGLANNGGPTQTIAIVSSSLAVDHGDASVLTNGGVYGTLDLGPLVYDQRGAPFLRNTGAFVDIGAYELASNKGRDLLAVLFG
jgi:hypothetical protein